MTAKLKDCFSRFLAASAEALLERNITAKTMANTSGKLIAANQNDFFLSERVISKRMTVDKLCMLVVLLAGLAIDLDEDIVERLAAKLRAYLSYRAVGMSYAIFEQENAVA